MKQQILPVQDNYGRVLGFFAIPETTFSGQTQSVPLSKGAVTASLVKVPSKADDPGAPTSYYAVVYPITNSQNQLDTKNWVGYTEFVEADYGYAKWSVPTIGVIKHFSKGFIATAITQSLDVVAPSVAVANPPVATNSNLIWTTQLANSNMLEIGFVDFNWLTQFQVSDSAKPLSIRVKTNDTTGTWRATLLGNPTDTGSGFEYTTIRLLKLKEVTASTTYTFEFTIVDANQLSVNATLNLTITDLG